MAKEFFGRLKDYYLHVGAVLRNEAEAASIFPNMTDIGITREQVYAEFLRTHLPSSCNVLLGGFVFNLNGDESKQIDLLITCDICPQFSFAEPHVQGKSFACIEGLLAAATIKSTLNSPELIDSLSNLASLPSKKPLEKRASPLLKLANYEDWPFKIVYASDGITLERLLQTLDEFYRKHHEIPLMSRPNLIHVAGKYNVVRIQAGGGMTRDGSKLCEGTFHAMSDQSDAFALTFAVQNIQKNAIASRHILFTYDEILDRIPF